MAKWLQPFSLLAAKLISDPSVKVGQNTTPNKTQDALKEPENIRESVLNFAAQFGEINPDMPNLC